MGDDPDDDACLDYLWRRNFSEDGQTATCPACEEVRRFSRVANRPSYRCTSCGYNLHPTAGTIFQKSSTPLHLWFRAVSLLAVSGSTVTAKQLERELGVTYKTAWRMSRLIRSKLAEPHADLAETFERVTRTAARAVPPRLSRPGEAVWAPGVISTFAGDGTPAYGGDGGPATGAQISSPYDVAVDDDGNVFIADEGNHVIRRVDTAGIITTVAGTGAPGYSGDGGPATAAQLCGPTGVAVDDFGNVLVADHQNHVVRRIDRAGIITTIVGNGKGGFSGDGGRATSARLDWPGRVLPVGDELLISDYRNNRVRRVDAAGTISTIAGDGSSTSSGDGGPATNAGVVGPNGLAVDESGNLYVAQPRDPNTPDARVRKISPSGVITTIAGGQLAGFAGEGGPADLAWLSNPHDIALDAEGGVLIADLRNHRVRRVDPEGTISTVVGTGNPAFGGNGGDAAGAQLNRPAGLAITPDGDLLIADSWNNRIRKVTGPVPDLWMGRTRSQGIPAARTGDRQAEIGVRWPMSPPSVSV